MALFTFSDLPAPVKDFSVAIVASEFNSEIVESMLNSAMKTFRRAGISAENIFVQTVPGAFEIPFAVKVLQSRGGFDGILTLGAVVRGETFHFELVAREAARGIMERNLFGEIPVVFGVLATENFAQAEERIKNVPSLVATTIAQMNLKAEN